MMAVAMGVGRFAYTPLLVVMRGDAGLDVATAGLLASANLAGYLAGALAAMLPAMQKQRARTVTLSAYGVAALTAAMAGPASTWLAARTLTGVLSGFVFVLAVSMTLELAAATRSRWGSAVFFAGVGAGIAAAGALVPLLVLAGGSRGAWLQLGALSAIAVALAAPFLPRGGGVAANGGATSRRRDARGFWWLAFVYGVEGAVYIIPATFLVAMVHEVPNIAALAPYAWVVVGLAAAPSVVLWSEIAARGGTERAFIASGITQGIALLVPFVAPPIVGVPLLAIGVGGTFIGMTALGTSLGRAYWSGTGNVAVGLLTVLYGIGQIAGPLVATHVALRTGSYRGSLAIAAAAILTSTAAFAIRYAIVSRTATESEAAGSK